MAEYNAKKPNDFGRKFSGGGCLLILAVVTILIIGATIIYQQLHWNAFLNKIEPRENWEQVVKNMRDFQKKNARFPADFAEAGNAKWKWISQPLVTNATVGRNKVRVSRTRYGNYEYLYSQLDENTAVMWAVPVWVDPTNIEPGYLDKITGYNAETPNWVEAWKKLKKTFYVVFFQKNMSIWSGVIPPQPSVTAGLEANLEPTPEWLASKGLKESHYETWKK